MFSLWFATLTTLCVALLWLKLTEMLAASGAVGVATARKIVHIGTGIVYMLCWPLFPADEPSARLWAASVPLLITMKFAAIGCGLLRDEKTVQSMSRTGDPRELLRGPLSYGIVFIACTVRYWLDSPVGIVALVCLCVGDGFADIVGRRFGAIKLPWSPRKSYAGSIAFAVSSLIGATVFVVAFDAFALLAEPIDFVGYVPRLAVIVVAAALIESAPVNDWDNVTVFIGAVATSYLLGAH
jgi:phytol kinase